jgi:hypothetical protein
VTARQGHASGDDYGSGAENGEKPLDPGKRHRHDIGLVDHGPGSSGSTTHALQILLGLWIFLTLALVIWAMATPAAPAATAPTTAAPKAP